MCVHDLCKALISFCSLSVFVIAGLQAAMDMQEKITAGREQIDSLQGKIQHLQETIEKLHQVKSLNLLVFQISQVRLRSFHIMHFMLLKFCFMITSNLI